MQGMKAVPGEQTQKVPPCGTAPRHRLQKRTMKTLTKIALALAIVLFATVLASHAGEWVNGYTRTDGTCVSGYYRNTPAPSYSTTPSYNSTPSYPAYSTGGSSGYVFRNPYAATPSVSVRLPEPRVHHNCELQGAWREPVAKDLRLPLSSPVMCF